MKQLLVAKTIAIIQVCVQNSVWNDPHIGGDHGFVEWVRAVVDEDTLLATAHGAGSGFEAWRPLMEADNADADGDSEGGSHWCWEVYSKAWAEEWAENKQFPFLEMEKNLATAVSKIDNNTLLWAKPRASPWPAWHGHETVPITDFEGIAAPWNTPTSEALAAGQTKSFAIKLTIASKGPRTRNDALLAAGRSALTAVPGYVISAEMTSAKIVVALPAGVTLVSVAVSNSSLMTATIAKTVATRCAPGTPSQHTSQSTFSTPRV